MVKVGVLGGAGRMGQLLVETILDHKDLSLAGVTVRAQDAALGQDVGALVGRAPVGIFATDNLHEVVAAADCVIDFTAPEALPEHIKSCLSSKTALVLGTTGLTAADQNRVEVAAELIPIVQAANMSVGVTIMAYLVEKTSALLGDQFDLEIFEAHHRHKVDAPSGTALMLGKAAAKGRNVCFEEKATYDRSGARKVGDIGFSVLRGGDIIGEHTVSYNGPKERFELTHKAAGREIFANGAAHAALFTKGKAAGLYDMKDVLGLNF